MTTREDAEVTAPDMESALELVRSNALQLLAGFTRVPTVLRICAGGVTLEAEWPAEVATAPPDPAGLNGSAVALATATMTSMAAVATGPADAAAAGISALSGQPVCAPAVGVFFQASAPDADPFVSVGDTVVVGQQLGIIEVMKLMIPVKATVGGTVTAVLKANAEPVEYDEPLFLVSPLG